MKTLRKFADAVRDAGTFEVVNRLAQERYDLLAPLRRAEAALNAALGAVHAAGLRAEVEVLDLASADREHARPLVTVRVYEPL